jgi:hypothetical protein
MDDRRPHEFSPEESLGDIFFSIESKNWRRPRTLTLQNLGGALSVQISEEVLAERNVTSVEYVNQESNPDLPPNTFRVNTRTHIAVDDNYIYVWVPSLNRWKRALLSIWDIESQ